jgi:type IV secretion system protein VirB10
MSDTSAAMPQDARPTVAKSGGTDWVMWAFFALLAVGGLYLFNALSAADEPADAPAIAVPPAFGEGRIASPPPLDVPARFEERGPLPKAQDRRAMEQPGFRRSPPPVATLAPPPPVQQPQLPPARPLYDPPEAPPAQSGVPLDINALVAGKPAAVQVAATDGSRVTAERFINPSLTIPQGTVIPAVLETALDSTRPGGVRALVQRDVLGFDGTRTLVPRGSRLYGEYEANLQSGQNRALVQWKRLIRPDGVTIALDSPSSDPLGRAGVRGKVDSKFFQRFGNALLQSVVDIGVGVAVNEVSDGVVVALPGSTQNVQITDQQRFLPTLKVKHGTSVSVFVARDLDFSTVDS